MPREHFSATPGRASYLLHIWQEQADPAPVWRASVTVIAGGTGVDGRRLGFPHPEAALRFLTDSLREQQRQSRER